MVIIIYTVIYIICVKKYEDYIYYPDYIFIFLYNYIYIITFKIIVNITNLFIFRIIFIKVRKKCKKYYLSFLKKK